MVVPMAVSTTDAAPAHVADPALQDAPIDDTVGVERRRPGRQDVDPTLLPLLRDASTAGPADGSGSIADDPALEADDVQEDGTPFRGILVGLMLALPFWCILGYAAVRIFR